MKIAILEHVNITVSNPIKTATMMCDIFGWHIRWEGPSMDNGYTVHVGTEDGYLAIYSNGLAKGSKTESYLTRAGLNHNGIVVEDLDIIEAQIKKLGYTTHSHGDYEPGQRFYFPDADNVEYEIVSYISQKELFNRQVTRQIGQMTRFGALQNSHSCASHLSL